MEFLKNIVWTPKNIMKAVGAVVAVLIVFPFVYTLLNSLTSTLGLSGGRSGGGMLAPQSMGGAPSMFTEDAFYNSKSSVSSERASGMVPIPTLPGGVVGDTAENFEVTEYRASIETREKVAVCGEVFKLKKLTYVIFENANDSDRGCNYTFKVRNANVAEILAVVKNLKPKDLTESTYTIKRQLDEIDSEATILKRKLASVNKTLGDAIKAYDEVNALAIRAQNVDVLAKIINNKMELIERLTRQQIDISAQLERLSRAKVDNLDRVDYTYFYVNVYENKFVDGKAIKDSWKNAIRNLVDDINDTTQGMTISLISFLFAILQYVLYFLVLLIIGKYLWKFTKSIWQK
ncbi:MAG: hypothetical protein AAB552_03990 [Patescibacteria group bacterium]